ncbi:uncharacterized protein LOC143151365 [Ptiloglossa arizonensis]|uniref:uncharacterized protein LOC143151365 n=1 Tax=Ptiloglossa arizonensis TaxID=3350558 RepID=UPI003FA113F4
MRLSTVVELLLILLLIAFAAYGRVIDHDRAVQRWIKNANGFEQSNVGISTLSLKQATDNVNRYCTCNENICNCCRDFHIPLVQLQGPGCASLQYLQEDNLAVQLSFGDNILTSTIVNGKNPKPVCVPLPGGFTKFCGRIYSIQRDAKNHFKACLGLELQSSTELEASLRVSCFRFGPDGLKLRPAEPLPVVEAEAPEDDDDDFFGLGSDEDDDNEGDTPLVNSVPNSSNEEDEDEDEDDEDVLGFGALLDIITGDDESSTKKPKPTSAAPLLQFTIPILTKPTSVPPLESHEPSTAENSVADNNDDEKGENEYNQSPNAEEEDITEENGPEFPITDAISNEAEEIVTEASNKIAAHAKPAKAPANKLTMSEVSKKKPSIASNSINAIENETNKKKKPLRKPVKGDEDDDDDILGTDLDDDDDDDEDEEILNDDDDENDSDEEEEDEKEHENNEDEDEKGDEVEDLVDDDDDDDVDDDDDDAEDAVISALVYDEKENGKKGKVKKNHQTTDADDGDDDDADYGFGLSGLLARSRYSRSGRQSKVMRF